MKYLRKKFCLFFMFSSFIVLLSVFLVNCAPRPQNKEQVKAITVWHWMSDREDAFLELYR